MFHNKLNGITGFTATETFEDAFGWRNGKRRGFFVMKRAKADIDPSKTNNYENPLNKAKKL